MGNVDMTANEKFMINHSAYTLDFVKETPLFDPEEIKFPLSTQGAKIVDSTGRRVKIVGGSWSGAHMCRHCIDGLQCRPLREMAKDIKYKFHLNCVRVTYSLQLFFDNNIIDKKYLTANPQLIGKTSMQILDFTIKTLTDVGLMVILNNHTSTSQWCCSNDDGDGLWWSYKYPENMFFQCAEEFARRYKDNPLVIGMDIRNQLRKAHGIEATWGDGNPLTDWQRAAKICGEKVLAIAPHWLIIVAGLNYQLDLTCARQTTINYSVKNKLVYSGHLYSFSWPPSWASFSYDAFKKKLFNSQTFIRGYGYPFILGEFGNNRRDTPWNYLIEYLKQTDIDWIYWPIDGFKCDPNDPDKDETYGLFTHNFTGIRNPDIFNDLRKIGAPLNLNLPKKSKEQIDLSEKNKQKQTSELNLKGETHSSGEKIEQTFQLPSYLKQIKSCNAEQQRRLNKKVIRVQASESIRFSSIIAQAISQDKHALAAKEIKPQSQLKVEKEDKYQQRNQKNL